MDMDKDVASAIVLERCNCYDSSLESAKKALLKEDLPQEQHLATREVVRSLGALYFKQHCLEKVLECYQLLQEAPQEQIEGTPRETDEQQEQENVQLTFSMPKDLYEIFSVLGRIADNQGKDQDQLLREGITLLVLKYSMEQSVRDLVLAKARDLFSSKGEKGNEC